MRPGDRLYPDSNAEGRGAVLRYQSDGNVVLYDRQGAIWAADVSAAAGYLEMQHDGNLVAYDAAGTPYWASDTYAPGASLQIARTGLQIVTRDNGVVWFISTGLEAPARPDHPDPLVGQFRSIDNGWGDDTGMRIPSAIHLGDAIGQALCSGSTAVVEPVFDFVAACGYHIARMWWQLFIRPGDHWDVGPPHRKIRTHRTRQGWSPLDNRVLFAETLHAAARRGIRLHLAGGGTRGLSVGQERELFDCLQWAIREVGPEHIALVEWMNEARDCAREVTPESGEACLAPIRAEFPQILYALTAYTGHEDREPNRADPRHDPKQSHRLWTPSWQPFVLQHDYRDGELHDKLRHMFSNLNEHEGPPLVRKKIYRGEPGGWGWLVSAIANQHQLDAHGMTMLAAMAALTRSVWTYFSGPGVILESEPIETMPAVKETPALLRSLPQDLARFDILSHSGPNWRGRRIHAVREDAPDVREDYAIDSSSGRFLAIRYGPPEQRHDFARERVFWDQTVYHEGRWGRVFGGRLS